MQAFVSSCLRRQRQCLHLQLSEIPEANSKRPPLPVRRPPAEEKTFSTSKQQEQASYVSFMTSNYALTYTGLPSGSL